MMVGPTLAATTATAGAYLVDKLRALDGRLQLVAPRVLTSTGDEDAVHDLRVVLRRARVLLEVGRPVLGRFHTDEVRRALRDVQRATGALRDEEVLLGLIASLGVLHPDVQGWVDGRKRRERRLRGSLARMVRSGDLERGRTLLSALLAFRVNPSRDKRLAKFARRSVDDARREVDRRRSARPDDSEAMHRLRISYKRLRYTVETFSDTLPSDIAALAHPAARFQGRLGDLHDTDTAVGCVRRARALSHEARSELLAALTHEREERLAAYLRELGIAPLVPLNHAVGTESLRKISTR